MRKNIVIALIGLLFVSVSSFAQSTNILKFGDNLSIKPGMTADIDVILENSTEAEMLVCDIELPEGIDPVNDATGAPMATMNSERMNGHSISTIEKTNPHRVRIFIMSSGTGKNFVGNSGVIFTFSIKASSTYNGGNLKITSKSYITNVNGDIYLNAYEAELKADKPDPYGGYKLSLSPSPVTVKAGETAEMQIMLDNAAPVNGWYAVFTFPEGIKVTNATLGRTVDHILTYDFDETTRELIIFADSQGAAGIKDIPGTSGAVATIVIEASSELTAQTMNVQMKDAYVAYSTTTADVEDGTFQIEVTAAEQVGPFSISLGTASFEAGKSTDIDIMLDNATPVNGWYAVFTFPEGIKVTNATLGRTVDHILTWDFDETTRELIIFADSNGAAGIKDIPGTSGAVATITVEADESITTGSATISMTGAYVAYADTTKDVDDDTFTFVTTAIQNVENAAANNGAIYNLSGQRVSKAANGIFIQNGKKAVVK